MEILTNKGERLCGVTKIEVHPLLNEISIFFMGDRRVLHMGNYKILSL
jgi:hypothetical protein